MCEDFSQIINRTLFNSQFFLKCTQVRGTFIKNHLSIKKIFLNIDDTYYGNGDLIFTNVFCFFHQCFSVCAQNKRKQNRAYRFYCLPQSTRPRNKTNIHTMV